MKATRFLALGIALFALAGAALAQGVAWDSLSDAQRQLLAPYAERWQGLDPARQEQIARGAQRWLDMNRSERDAARDRFQIWRGMTDQQLRRIP